MLSHDLRAVWRHTRLQPGVVAIILITLAIGIGANTATFSIIDTVLLRPLPFEDSERLVIGRKSYDGGVTSNGPVSGYDYYDYKEQSRSFDSLAMMTWGPWRATVIGEEDPERVDVQFVSWDLFPMLGVAPQLGRWFLEEEAVVDGPPVAMLSHAYWQRRYGGSPDVIGSNASVNGRPFTIIGVMPAGFHFLFETDAWTLTYRDGPGASARRWHNLLVVGKLRPEVSLEQARHDVDSVSASLSQLYPESNDGKSLMLTPLRDFMVENVRTSLLLLMGTVVLVLLIACSNVAGLLLARGQSRANDIAIRSAVGASRYQMVREHLVESMVQAVVAGMLGVGVAVLFQRLLLRLLPLGQVGIEPRLDGGVLLFTLVISLATGLLFGVLPAVRSTSMNLAMQLRSGTRGTEDGRGTRLRSLLVSFQVAMAVFLLVGSGLLTRSLAGQMSIDLGFRPQGLLTAGIEAPTSRYPELAQRQQLFQEVLDQVRVLPGVESAALINQLPIRSPWNDIYAWPLGSPPASARENRSAYDRIVRPGYFASMDIPIILGRDIADTDAADALRVVVIGERMAREFFPEVNPIGQHLVIDLGETVEHEVVGVVGDVRMTSARSEAYRTMYTAHAQRGGNRMDLAVRTTVPPGQLVAPIRQVLKGLDRDIPLAEPATMSEVIDRTLADFRIVTFSLGLFSVIALALTAIGLYSVLAFWVSRRIGELGIRMALGATGAQLIALVTRRGLVVVGLGLLPGLTAAVLGSRMLQQLLFEVHPVDPLSYFAASLFLATVSMLACLVPAVRAMRINPVKALRAE
jgi:putative ABC transport system permease protein